MYKPSSTNQAELKSEPKPEPASSDSHSHKGDPESLQGFDDSAATQIIGIAILEFGVALHRSVVLYSPSHWAFFSDFFCTVHSLASP